VGESTDDLRSRLLEARTIFLGSELDDEAAKAITAQLLYLQFENKVGDIHMYINSRGSSLAAALMVHDTIKLLKNPLATYAIGQAAGTACLLLASGARGKRFALPNARIGFSRLTAKTDELAKLKAMTYAAFCDATGKSLAEIERAHDAQERFDAQGAKAYGLVDEVIDSAPGF
jgi:ATP-dependent Clp protease protease subunit